MSRSKTPRSGTGGAPRPSRSRRPRPDLAAAAQAAASIAPSPDDAAGAAATAPMPPVAGSDQPAPDPVRPIADDVTAMSLSLLDFCRQATEAHLTFWSTLLGPDARPAPRRDDEAA